MGEASELVSPSLRGDCLLPSLKVAKDPARHSLQRWVWAGQGSPCPFHLPEEFPEP